MKFSGPSRGTRVLDEQAIGRTRQPGDQQRAQGRDAASQRFKTGADKVGLDTLRSFIDRTTGDMAEFIITLQRRSKDYRDITAYCVLFGAFWFYVIILLATRRPRGEEQ